MRILMITAIILIIVVIVGLGYFFSEEPDTDNISDTISSDTAETSLVNDIIGDSNTDDQRERTIVSPTNKNQKYTIPKEFNPLSAQQIQISLKKGSINELTFNDPIDEVFGVLGIADKQLEKGNKRTELYYNAAGMKCILKDLKLQQVIVYFSLMPDNMSRFSGKSIPSIKYNASKHEIFKIFGEPYTNSSDGFTRELYYKFDDHYCIFTIGEDNDLLCYIELRKK